MSLTLKEVQQSVYTALTSNATLMGLIEGVYDHVPQTTDRAYVRIGEGDFTERGSHTTDGESAEITIHCWFEGRGRLGVYNIMEQIRETLHNTDLSFTGYNNLSMLESFKTTMQEADGVTYHGIQRFNILIGNV